MTSQPQQDPARSIALSRLAHAALGTRFSVRYALPTGDPSGKGRTDAIGTLVSAATAFLVVKWLLRFIQTHTFVAFGWYRVAMGGVTLLVGK